MAHSKQEPISLLISRPTKPHVLLVEPAIAYKMSESREEGLREKAEANILGRDRTTVICDEEGSGGFGRSQAADLKRSVLA